MTKWELANTAKLSVFVPVIIFGHESWVITARIQSPEKKQQRWNFYEELTV